jgi:hypothetical protein
MHRPVFRQRRVGFLRAAALLVSLLVSPAAWSRHGHGVDSDEPAIEHLRAIQYDYSSLGGTLVVIWDIDGGPLDSLGVTLDDKSYFELHPGDLGLRMYAVPPGDHQITVEGEKSGRRIRAAIDHQVLTTSPVDPVVSAGCLFYAYDARSQAGLLQVAWQAARRPTSDPLVEFEVTFDNDPSVLVEASDNVLTLSGVAEGKHHLTITAITETDTSPQKEVECNARGLLPPSDLRLAVSCSRGVGAGTLTYQLPAGTRYDALAVWLKGEEGREFRGYYSAAQEQVYLKDLPERQVQVEIAGALFDRDSGEPLALTNLPGGPGAHVVAQAWINCEKRSEFKRGDAGANGKVSISDAVQILQFLFMGGTDLPCEPAADVDDSGGIDLTDPVVLLGYLFAGGKAPEPPGPAVCGEEPHPAGLKRCDYAACN